MNILLSPDFVEVFKSLEDTLLKEKLSAELKALSLANFEEVTQKLQPIEGTLNYYKLQLGLFYIGIDLVSQEDLVCICLVSRDQIFSAFENS